MFGQPCSGKTTLADLLMQGKDEFFSKGSVFSRKVDAVHLDGDKFREIYKNNFYGMGGRMVNISRAASVARYLEFNGNTVICSFVTPYKQMRDMVRAVADKVAFVYLTYDEKRGREDYHVGDFELPDPKNEIFLHINTSETTPAEAIEKIINFCNKLNEGQPETA